MEATLATPDPELCGLLERGDLRAAGTVLVERYAGDVVGLCRAMVRERHTAEDLAQETFSKAFRGLRSFRREASPRTWVLAIARNGCLDYLRRRSRTPIDELDWSEAEDSLDVSGQALPADLVLNKDEIMAALDALSESERALVVLRVCHELNFAELANVFGARQGAVRMRLSRALTRMRSALEAREAALGNEVADDLALPLGAPAAAPAARSRAAANLPESTARGRTDAPAPGSSPVIPKLGAPPAPAGFGAPHSAAPVPVAGPARKSVFARVRGWFSRRSGLDSPAPFGDAPSEGLMQRLFLAADSLPG